MGTGRSGAGCWGSSHMLGHVCRLSSRKGNKLAASSGAGGFHVGVCFVFKASAGEGSAFQPVHVPLVSSMDVFVFRVGIN